jgi:hypothetical protein
MELALVVNFLVALIVGVLGGLIGSWSSWRYLLVLDQRQKAFEVAIDDRVSAVHKVVTRQDKIAAVETRWAQKKTKDEKLAEELTALPANQPAQHPWDPRTWGKSA